MKLIIYLIVFVLFYSSLFSQHNNTNLTEYTITFQDAKIASENKIQEVVERDQAIIDRLNPRSIKSAALSLYIESLPVNDFLDIIDKRIKAYEEDLFKLKEYILKHDMEASEKFGGDSITFGEYEVKIRRHLGELYGDVLARLILSPILIKVEINGIGTEPYKIDEDEYIGLKIITAKIQDIVKGNNHFREGETIQFYYIPSWVGKEISLLANESYFISLIPVNDTNYGEKRLALEVNEVNGGITRVAMNLHIDDENYYGFGKISWQEFKEKISASININLLKGE